MKVAQPAKRVAINQKGKKLQGCEPPKRESEGRKERRDRKKGERREETERREKGEKRQKEGRKERKVCLCVSVCACGGWGSLALSIHQSANAGAHGQSKDGQLRPKHKVTARKVSDKSTALFVCYVLCVVLRKREGKRERNATRRRRRRRRRRRKRKSVVGG